MPEILFNAFSFLQKKFKNNGFPYLNVPLTLPEKSTVQDLLIRFNLKDHEVEAVMVNGKSGAFDHEIQEGDRIALIPPGTPGARRFIFKIKR